MKISQETKGSHLETNLSGVACWDLLNWQHFKKWNSPPPHLQHMFSYYIAQGPPLKMIDREILGKRRETNAFI